MNDARSAQAATLLNNGMVLMVAGETEAFLGEPARNCTIPPPRPSLTPGA